MHPTMNMRTCRNVGVIAAIVIGVGALAGGVAGATNIVVPSGVPRVVANAPLLVTATGFRPGANVFIEQCDGVRPTKTGWDVTINCDLGTSPPAAIADAQGAATFPADDPNRAFRPFEGESPQSLFNCMSAGKRPPANDLPSFTDCKIRVSTNNSSVTADQVFLPIVLTGRSVPAPKAPDPATVDGSPTTSVPGRAGKKTTGTTAPHAHPNQGNARRPRAADPRSTVPGGSAAAPAVAPVATAASAAHAKGGAGLGAVSDSGVRTGYLLVALGLLLAFVPLFLPRRRRVRAPAPRDPMTATQPAGEGT
jgi:hypothetical protein